MEETEYGVEDTRPKAALDVPTAWVVVTWGNFTAMGSVSGEITSALIQVNIKAENRLKSDSLKY